MVKRSRSSITHLQCAGRKIMGELVPYGKVWRTGANDATTLITETDLTIGDLRVPAGTYTLYTLPGETEWKLIVNKKTGQWGTEYSEADDLGRVNLMAKKSSAPVEKFTISIEPASDGGMLKMAWENTELSVPVAAAASSNGRSIEVLVLPHHSLCG
ncbi:MAG: DUF2911 domain-containing protein [Pyrinomonadaceae bacterium]